MCKSICNLFKENNQCIIFFIICFILLGFVISTVSFIAEKWIENMYYVISIFLTLGLLSIAYSNLKDINKSINTKLLYQIDQRWGDDKILKAREILHVLLIESKNSNQEKYVSKKILLYYSDVSHSNKIILIINFIEFMETMGYLIYEEKTITEDQIKNLCGYEVRMFYPIFEDLIKILKKDYEDDGLFKNFKKMHDKIKP